MRFSSPNNACMNYVSGPPPNRQQTPRNAEHNENRYREPGQRVIIMTGGGLRRRGRTHNAPFHPNMIMRASDFVCLTHSRNGISFEIRGYPEYIPSR